MNNQYRISKHIFFVLLAFLSITFSCAGAYTPVANSTLTTSFKVQKFEKETIQDSNENSVFYRTTETKGKIRVKYQASYFICDLSPAPLECSPFVATLCRDFVHPDSFIYSADRSASYLRGPPAITS